MFDVITCAVTNMFRIYLVYKFVSLFLDVSERNKKKEAFAYICFYFANTILFLEFHMVWINVLSNLLGIGLVVWIRSQKVKTVIFITIIIYSINMVCDVIGTALFINYQDGTLHSQIYAVIALLLTFICELLTEKVVTSHKKIVDVPRNALIIVPACSILTVCFLTYSDFCTDKGLVIVSVSLLIMNFFTLYLYNQLIESVVQKYETEALKRKAEVYSNQLEVILQTNEKVRTLRHDMKHHMNELKLLAKKYEVKEIQDYIERMNAFIDNPKDVVSSGNMEIDSVLNYMLQKAKQELKLVNTKVELPEHMKHHFDVNIILGNLLDNAIESAKQTEEKYLKVGITFQKGILKIIIENSCLSKKLLKSKEGNRYLSTKQKKEEHGIGLKSVKKVVEQYQGDMEIISQNDRFCVSLLLYMSDKEEI